MSLSLKIKKKIHIIYFFNYKLINFDNKSFDWDIMCYTTSEVHISLKR
jgi:hypothetical protein